MSDKDQIRYDAGEASSYGSLGISGTTYQIGYDFARRRLRALRPSRVLDFGAGAGRSSEFLRQCGAQEVWAVDHSPAMVEQGRARNIPGVTYLLSRDAQIPLGGNTVDLAVSLFVFIEFTTLAAMTGACREVHRVMRDGGRFIIVSVSPDAFDREYKSFAYAGGAHRTSGDRIMCRVRTGKGILELLDTYWTAADYHAALSAAGFTIEATSYPAGSRPAFPDTDEPLVPPFVIIEAAKARAAG
jgi:ubiquinone/menaquinone biosynthesis C-methylase UbiE